MQTSLSIDTILRHVPVMNLPKQVDARQALGVELPVVAINLPDRTEKWKTVSGRMAAVGLDRVIRAPAIAAAKLSTAQIHAFLGTTNHDVDAPPKDHLGLTRPAVGCFMSHLAIWRWVIEADLRRVLVLEDDAVPNAAFDPARFHERVLADDKTSGLVFVGQRIMAGLAEGPGADGLGRVYYFNGTFAYLITPDACRFLLANLGQPRAHIDHQISHTLIKHRANFIAGYAEPTFFDSDWGLPSDCYVPMADESSADRSLGDQFQANRRMLIGEKRPLLPLGG